MHRPLAVSSTMLGDCVTADGLHEAVSRGITHLELSVPPHGATCPGKEQFLHVARLVSAAGMGVWSVHAPFGGGVDLSAPDELCRRESLQQVLRACEVASMLGAKCVVVHAGHAGEDPDDRERRRRQSLRSLNCLIKRTRQLGVQLAVEYLPANKPRLCNHSAQFHEFFGVCDGTPGVCLDANHANLREDLADATRVLADWLVTVHLSDNDGEQERHLMPGEGVIDWSEFMDVLDEIGYDGPLVYEAIDGESVAERMEMTARSAREVLGWEAPDG